MEKLLLTGSSGLVGSYFCRLLDDVDYDVSAMDHSLRSNIGKSFKLDLGDPMSGLEKIIARIEPDIIVHLAAMTNIDQCEEQKELADRINHLSTQKFAQHASHNKECFLLYVSTDYVFDGKVGNYKESSPTNPVNWYGKTKLFGEQELLNCTSDNWCIARTSTPFGKHEKKQSFPLFIIENLSKKKEVKIVTDQITSPTYSLNLAEMLIEIMKRRMKGILHVSGSSQVSRYDQAIQIASVFGLDNDLIKPIKMSEISWKAPRPQNSSLNIEETSKKLDIKPSKFQKSLRQFAFELGVQM